jgi:hypothetical protein
MVLVFPVMMAVSGVKEPLIAGRTAIGVLTKTPGVRGYSSHFGTCRCVPCIPNGVTARVAVSYLLMSSFASRRLSNGWRNGLFASGAPLIACVISLAAVGKSPLFDEIRASARWLIQ